MFASNSVSTQLSLSITLKVAAAGIIGAAVLWPDATASASVNPLSTLAQAQPGLTDPTSAYEPPKNPRPRRATLTTTGTYFRPPSNPRPRSGSRTTTGTRQSTCLNNSSEAAFTLMGPAATVGRSASSRPEFVWYLPDSEVAFPVVFRLLAPNEAGIPTPIYTAELPYTAGVVSYQLPPEVAALAADREYRWQVVIACHPNYPSRSLAQERSFEVVPASAELIQTVSSSASNAERALAYGQAGLWYDAIAQVAQSTTPAEVELRSGLLRDLANADTENEPFRQNLLNVADRVGR